MFPQNTILTYMVMVAGVGLEPTHRCRYRILSPTRLPISPPGRLQILLYTIYFYLSKANYLTIKTIIANIIMLREFSSVG